MEIFMHIYAHLDIHLPHSPSSQEKKYLVPFCLFTLCPPFYFPSESYFSSFFFSFSVLGRIYSSWGCSVLLDIWNSLGQGS